MKLVEAMRVGALLLMMAWSVAAQGLPRMMGIEPGVGKVGDEMTVTGENLDKKSVAEIFLTDGKSDIKLPIVQQGEKSIKFKLPAEAKPGKYSMMLMTAEAEPKLLEQPVRVVVQ